MWLISSYNRMVYRLRPKQSRRRGLNISVIVYITMDRNSIQLFYTTEAKPDMLAG